MYSSLQEPEFVSRADAADSLLLTLEVEAAAARHAELSRTVEELQEEVQRLRRNPAPTPSVVSPPLVSSSPPRRETSGIQHTPSASAPQPRHPLLDEPREVFIALDDLLFEVADIRSRLASTTCVDLTPRTFSTETTVTARALRCVTEVKKLKEALRVAQESSAMQVAELRRALGEQMAAQARQQSHFAVQRAMLERRCEELQRQYDDALATQGEKVLNRVIQSPAVRSERSVPRGEDAAVHRAL